MVKPAQTLLLLLLVMALLGAFVWTFPSGELVLSDSIKLHFVSLDEVLHPKDVKYADITNIVASDKWLDADSALLGSAQDTAFTDSSLQINDTFNYGKADIDALRNIKYKIQYPEGQENLLNDFFASLDMVNSQPAPIRIFHFGDSQIEGDRITGTIRNKMQHIFGGCGAGIIPLYDVADMRTSVRLKASSNWKKYAIYGNLHKGSRTNQYGMQGSVYRPLAQTGKDSTLQTYKNAWVQLSKSYNGYPNTNRFQEIKVYYGNAKKNATVSIFSGRNIWKDTLSEGGFQSKKLSVDSFAKDIKIEFPADLGADIYALSMDCKKGVAVDNVAMRGSSGTDFTRIDPAFFAQQLKAVNTKLLILQFGVNVVPNPLNDYSFYEKSYYRNLQYLRDNLPGVSILVIGISDVAIKDGSHYVTSPNLTLIRDAQKKAAFKAGCAFWDLYEAMGGENSMPSWVNAKPSLAEKDFTHFNANGAKIIGEMIYNALMREYIAYKNPDAQP
ncbi:MAG: hypothetical protein EOP53_04790 [Sphingobacteriales bacterium]|nr:MAG: hypothetical protein EOP53_04790 [Sphingobacteriales bacterium]